MNKELNHTLAEMSCTNLKRISKECPYIFLRGKYFLPIEDAEDKSPGIIVFFGNYHYLNVPGEFVENINEETIKKVSDIMNRKVEEDIYEAYEFLSLEVKSLILEIQAIAAPYHPNLSVWQLKSMNEFIDELEFEMMRDEINMSEVKQVTQKIMELGKYIMPKLDVLDEMEQRLQQ